MGLIIPYNIDDTIKWTRIKVEELLRNFYILTDDLKFVFVSVIVSHILALYVKDRLSKGDKKISEKVNNNDRIFIDIDSVMYMYSSVSVKKIIKGLHECRNQCAHDYPTPFTIKALNYILSQDEAIRELCKELDIPMQPKPGSTFDAAKLMSGE